MNGHTGGCSFDRMADSYDSWYDTPAGRMYDALEKRAVERILPAAANGNRLLEIGCGTGHWSAFFSAQGFTVSGVDISPQMVAVARGKEIPDASFQVADAHALPFEDGSFHVSVAITALEFVRDAAVVMREMVRCTCRPGGVILVGVLNALSRLNRRRKAAGKPPYDSARLFSPREVKAMLSPYGEARAACSAFVPLSAWLLPVAPVTDAVGRLLRLRYGAFVVGRVIL